MPQLGRLAIVVPCRLKSADPSEQGYLFLYRCICSISDALENVRSDIPEIWSGIRVIVVDDYSKSSIKGLRKVCPTVEVLQNRGVPGQGGALNYALQSIDADVYGFTDSDCVVDKSWIRAFQSHLIEYPERLGVAGPNWMFSPGKKLGWKRSITLHESALLRASFLRYIDETKDICYRLDCRNLVLRDSFLKLVGRCWFPEGDGPSVSGQASHRLRQLLRDCSFSIGFEANAYVYHQPIDTLSGVIHKYYERGRHGNYHLYYATARGLLHGFIRNHFVKHFILPAAHGVNIVYLWLTHGAYWLGILRRSVSR